MRNEGGVIGRRRFLVAPAVAYLVILTQVPLVLTLYYSLRSWNLLRPESDRFVGLGSFSAVLRDPQFWPVIQTTTVLTLSVVIVTHALGLLFALLLNRSFPGRGLARTLLITPFLIMPTVSAVLWKNMLLNPAFGLFNTVLVGLGLDRIDALAHYPLVAVVAILSWQWTPFTMLILLAGLQSFPDELRDAASMDGAGPLAIFRHLVIPHLARYVEIAVLLEVLFVLSAFGEIFVATSGGPGISTTNLTYQIYREAFERWNIGRASALGVFAILLANMVLLLFLRLVRRDDRGQATA
ncbi:MAG TPA: sugar ABC transporter permease [Gemmatimonadota bacterium]|nr:sugar ABC transporter permease [Gemmatimonadota bacterium]